MLLKNCTVGGVQRDSARLVEFPVVEMMEMMVGGVRKKRNAPFHTQSLEIGKGKASH